MGTRTRVLTALAVVGAGAALALPGAAIAKTRSGVTAHAPSGGWRGFVFSPKPRKCADGRTVQLFKEKGKGQHPKRDRKVYETKAFKDKAGKYRWNSTGYGLHVGRFYARVPATSACKADNSKTVHISARPNTKISSFGCQGCGNGRAHRRNWYFSFHGFNSIPRYTFETKLDHHPYEHHRFGNVLYRHLSFGRHVFKVYAIAGTGKRDLTPAKQVFHVKRK